MGKRQFTAKETYEIIGRYHSMKKALGHHVEDPYASDGLIANYDNIGMPRGSSTGDPTGNKALSGLLPKHIEVSFKERILFVDKRMEAAKTLTERDILHWRLSGLKVIHIAELLGFHEKQVRRILHTIADEMSEMSVLSESA